MIRIEPAGAHTTILSDLCARCPQGIAGCCASPPGMELSDVGRIVALGGAAWLAEEIASGRLRPGDRGLLILRVEAREAMPRRCVYHGAMGCTIAPERRSATCNHYVCDDALEHGGEGQGDAEAIAARSARDLLIDLCGAWDREIAERVRARWPDGPAWDTAFLAWLGEQHALRVRASRRALRVLSASR